MLFLKAGRWNRYFTSPYFLVTGGLLGGLFVSLLLALLCIVLTLNTANNFLFAMLFCYFVTQT
jgi:DMSO reductase anchor subunit